MEVKIANPIYDVVFKYMMEDNAVAKLLISSIIGEEVTELEPRPQERAIEVPDPANTKNILTVYRLDFSAKLKTSDGYKTVLIELQKASVPEDIMRFRGYLGTQIADQNNSVKDEKGNPEPIRIYTIYFLGDDLKICDTPVLSVYPVVMDIATQKLVEARSKFIEMLNHKCWIVQISCLKQRRRNELEKLLHVFDQSNRTSDNHILNVREDDFPEKFRPVIRRLKKAASNNEIKQKMEQEDIHLRYIQSVARKERYEGKIEGKAEEKEDAVIRGYKKGRSIADIADFTDLSQNEVTQILKKHKLLN